MRLHLNITAFLYYVRRRQRVAYWLATLLFVLLAVLASVFATYLLTLQLFFAGKQLPSLDDRNFPSRRGEEDPAPHTEEFIVDGVAYVDGLRIENEPKTLELLLPAAMAFSVGDDLELFIKMLEPDSNATRKPSILTQWKTGGRVLKQERIRLTSPDIKRTSFDPNFPGITSIFSLRDGARPLDKITFALPDGQGPVLVAARMTPNLIPAIFLSFLALLGCAYGLNRLNFSCKPTSILLLIAIFGMSAIFHGGAVFSNAFITYAGTSIEAPFSALTELMESGELPSSMFWSPITLLVPFVTTLLEGGTTITHFEYVVNVLPTSRYVMFLSFVGGTSYLALKIRDVFSVRVAFAFALLTPLFIPFIIDMYNIAVDSYLIPLFAVWLAVALPPLFSGSASYARLAVLALILIPMLMVKITPLILVVVFPLAYWLANGRRGAWERWRMAGLVFIAFLFCYILAGWLNSLLWTDPRSVGQVSVISDTRLWEVLWSAAGDYDSSNPHGFVKVGSERDQRLGEMVGLKDPPARLRHSALADDILYRPGVLNAVKEQPQYFFSTANVRLWRHGITFLSYGRGGHRRWEAWADKNRDMHFIRRGTMWKTAPLATAVRFFQYEWSKTFEALAIGGVLLGSLGIPAIGLRVFIFLLFVGKYLALAWIHVLVRYTDFLNFVGLIVLSIMIVGIVAILRNWMSDHMAL